MVLTPAYMDHQGLSLAAHLTSFCIQISSSLNQKQTRNSWDLWSYQPIIPKSCYSSSELYIPILSNSYGWQVRRSVSMQLASHSSPHPLFTPGPSVSDITPTNHPIFIFLEDKCPVDPTPCFLCVFLNVISVDILH